MYCYYCEQRHPGGTNYGSSHAHGICKNCGVAVCIEHSQKKDTPGAPLLCFDCIKLSLAGKIENEFRGVTDLQANVN
jgi:hypothetical protein